MSHPVVTRNRFSRRAVVGAGVTGAALAPLAAVPRAFARDERTEAVRLPYDNVVPGIGPHLASTSPATWRTWILTSADELRPEAPGDPSADEVHELLELFASRDDAANALIATWNSRPAVLIWTELANAAFSEFGLSALRQTRAQALLQTAMYDAVVAAADAQNAYRPAQHTSLSSNLIPQERLAPDHSTFPSEQAAVAGAAAAVLTGLLPDAAPGRFTTLADEAAHTRFLAGHSLRRDIEAGRTLGAAIGERALAFAAADRPGSEWDGTGRLTGDGYWVPTPPAFLETPHEPLATTWQLWVLDRADAFRPAPSPAYDSVAWQSQLAAVQEAVARRTPAQANRAAYWQDTAGPTLWNGFAADLITRHNLPLPQAARVLALLAVAQADAHVACWDGKYAYWTARPITVDPALDVLFPTPPFPSFPSAHATVSNAGAVVLAHCFPDEASELFDLAEEAAASRAWAGIHYPVDNDAGTLLGRQIGYLVTARARTDDADHRPASAAATPRLLTRRLGVTMSR